MWTALVILGFAALLAWKAPRAFKKLLIAGGVLLLLAALGIGVYALLEKRKADRIAALFVDPSAPEPLARYRRNEDLQRKDLYRHGVFNVSATTAYVCYVRMVKHNEAGVQVDANAPHRVTVEPFAKEDVTVYGFEEGWTLQIAGCEPHVRGEATSDPLMALMRTSFFKGVDSPFQAKLLKRAGASEDFIKEHMKDSGDWVTVSGGDTAPER